MEFLQVFSFAIKHTAGALNKVADALSRRHSLLSTMQVRVLGFDYFKDLYADDPSFGDIWRKCKTGPFQQFLVMEGFLFKGNRLCIPQWSLRESIIIESHAGGLAGHFRVDKTMALLCEHFYWPRMERE